MDSFPGFFHADPQCSALQSRAWEAHVEKDFAENFNCGSAAPNSYIGTDSFPGFSTRLRSAALYRTAPRRAHVKKILLKILNCVSAAPQNRPLGGKQGADAVLKRERT